MKFTTQKTLLALAASACLLPRAMANITFKEKPKEPIELEFGSQYEGKRQDAAMQAWREHRFGQFIHWGLYSIAGGEWDGKIYPTAAEWLQSKAKVSTEDWMGTLMPQFNPTEFDAQEWAKIAKTMGAKYMTITTKHHDGFCLWPSEFSPYTVANTPYEQDILRELVDAHNAEGIEVYFYFSIMDWSHEGWKGNPKTEAEKAKFAEFQAFTENQLRELAENYPSVKGFWFDGTWDPSVKYSGDWTYNLEMMLKGINPELIVNSRLRADEKGARHLDSNGELMGDYYSGYERKLPHPVRDLHVTEWDWEAVMTVPQNQWGYHKEWSLSHVKTTDEVLKKMIRSFAMGGNFMLNFGPKGDGSIREEEIQLAEEIGAWLEQNGEAVYGTDFAGFEKMDWGYYTQKTGEESYYLHVLHKPLSGKLEVILPRKVQSIAAKSIDGSQKFPVDFVDGEYATRQVYQIELPDGFGAGQDLPVVLKLQLDLSEEEAVDKEQENV